LLARLKGSDFLARRAFEVHREQQRPDHESGHASRNILADLQAFFASKLLDLGLVCS
jgi:hypothetical protein